MATVGHFILILIGYERTDEVNVFNMDTNIWFVLDVLYEGGGSLSFSARMPGNCGRTIYV
jgi:hypothetical protein